MSELVVYIGTYTTGAHPGMPSADHRPDYKPPAKLESKGIYVSKFNASNGKLSNAEVAAESVNPSYLCVHPSGTCIYAVNEIDDFEGKGTGAVSSFGIQQIKKEAPKLQQLNQTSSQGAIPCHVSIDKAGENVFVANYVGGNVAVYPIGLDGSVSDPSAVVKTTGSGPNPIRQTSSHPHSVTLDPLENRYVLVTDLGTDELRVYKFDEGNGSLTDHATVKIEPGSGPRQLVWHPSNKYAYIINELNSTITALKYTPGNFEVISTLDITPTGYTSTKWSSEIRVHPNGKFLYATNRIADSFMICSINDNGTLAIVGHHPTNGKTPRNFVIDPTGNFLVVANQHSDNVTSFSIDQKTGHLHKVSEIKVPAAACVVFYKK